MRKKLHLGLWGWNTVGQSPQHFVTQSQKCINILQCITENHECQTTYKPLPSKQQIDPSQIVTQSHLSLWWHNIPNGEYLCSKARKSNNLLFWLATLNKVCENSPPLLHTSSGVFLFTKRCSGPGSKEGWLFSQANLSMIEKFWLLKGKGPKSHKLSQHV